MVAMSVAWCITCLVNERVTPENGAVKAALCRRSAASTVDDWTNRDRTVTAYLEAHHREVAPFYVYCPRDHAASVVLPQILTPSTIRRILHDEVG